MAGLRATGADGLKDKIFERGKQVLKIKEEAPK